MFSRTIIFLIYLFCIKHMDLKQKLEMAKALEKVSEETIRDKTGLISELAAEIKKGNSVTGNPIKDFVIAVTSKLEDEEFEKDLESLANSIESNQGKPILISAVQSVRGGRDGCFSSSYEQISQINHLFGILNGKLTFKYADNDFSQIKIPTDKFVKVVNFLSKAFEVKQGQIKIYSSDILNNLGKWSDTDFLSFESFYFSRSLHEEQRDPSYRLEIFFGEDIELFCRSHHDQFEKEKRLYDKIKKKLLTEDERKEIKKHPLVIPSDKYLALLK